MNNIEIVKDQNFQELFLKHFIYEGGVFVDDKKEDTEIFQYGDNSIHDQMIQNGYVFFIADEGFFFIYENMFVFCDNEAGFTYLGNNLLTLAKDIKEYNIMLGVHEIKEFNIFKKKVINIFGEMDDNEFSMTSEEFNEKYDLV